MKKYILITLLLVIPHIHARFGKGFAAGLGTFAGVSLLSNAIAANNQPRTVYVENPAPSYDPYQDAYYQQQEAMQAQERNRIALIQEENRRKQLELDHAALKLKERELALKEAQLNK